MTTQPRADDPIAYASSRGSGSAAREHLDLFRILYFVLSGLMAFGGCIPIIHLTIGIGLICFAPPATPADPFPTVLFGIFFIVMALFLMAICWTAAVLAFLMARNLKQPRRLMFCKVIAGIACAMFPLGTALGVPTLIVLLKPETAALFVD